MHTLSFKIPFRYPRLDKEWTDEYGSKHWGHFGVGYRFVSPDSIYVIYSLRTEISCLGNVTGRKHL